MILGCKIVYFAVRELSMAAEKRSKRSKLEPTEVQFAPFVKICIFQTCFVKCFLSFFVTFFNTETANIHSPEWNTRHGKVESCRYLRLHIFPTGSYVATPGGCRVALQTGKSGTGKEKDT